MKYFSILLSKKFAPRWLILLIDLTLCIFSVILAYLLRFNFDFNNIRQETFLFPYAIATFFAVRLLAFYFTKTYHGVIRYTSTQDAKNIFIALTTGTVLVSLQNLIFYISSNKVPIPFSVVVIEYFTTAILMGSFRIFVKILYSELKSAHIDKKNVLIFGAGESGVITKRTIDQDKDSSRKIVGFMDDDIQKRGKSLEGVNIYNFDMDFVNLVNKLNVSEVVISVQDLNRERKGELVDECLKNKVQVKIVPPATSWINGEFKVQQISDIRIEDLLEREAIKLDQDNIFNQISGSRVLVTGACGSIGSELVRQIVKYYPKELILIDQAETPLYELELELREKSSFINFRVILSDISNKHKMEVIMERYRPQIIYHAAAYKHVPLMEENPVEAVLTNIAGTKYLADLAVMYDVREFVYISTDKAVNPTNVMGASKRIAEIYVQSLNSYLDDQRKDHTLFITTRFGNVLGSNGSVIPRFRKQIESGGPLTVTHPEISRYFMTIPEACQLILEAGMMGNGGEIYVFDMGDPVKIVDLAKKMIVLSGFKPGKDIQIVFTGLRPGEKIQEELLNNKETTLATHHEKILIGKVRKYSFQPISKEIDELIDMISTLDDKLLVAKMKSIVPEYVSNNSVFEELDKINVPPGIKIES
jgi:FlaA1/EpsC-like NDP-sugar epimerase